jgi:hypothetical protein
MFLDADRREKFQPVTEAPRSLHFSPIPVRPLQRNHGEQLVTFSDVDASKSCTEGTLGMVRFNAGVRCKGRATSMPKERVGVSWGEIMTALAVMGIITFLLLL